MFDIINNNLNSKMTDEEIRKVISENNEVFFEEVGNLIESIKNGINKNTVFDNIRQQCDNEILCNIVINIISSELVPFEDMEYLRNVDIETFREKIEYLFNNIVLQFELVEVIKKETGFTDEEFECSVKLLNTITDWIVVRRFTIARFNHDLYEMFRFDDQKSNYLFQLYKNNTQELTNIALLDNIALIKSIKNDVTKLLDIFKNIFDSEDSDKE